MATTNHMKQQGEHTRTAILEAGLKLWPNVTATAIATELGITHATVLYHFPDLKNSIAQYAVETGCSTVIVQLLITNHPAVKNMTGAERLKHFAALS